METQALGNLEVLEPGFPDCSTPSVDRDRSDRLSRRYYLTPRGQHPNAPNKMLIEGASYMVPFAGFDRVETLLTQPVLIVAGTEAGTLWHSRELYAKAPGPKEFARTLTPTQS